MRQTIMIQQKSAMVLPIAQIHMRCSTKLVMPHTTATFATKEGLQNSTLTVVATVTIRSRGGVISDFDRSNTRINFAYI